MKFDKIIYTLAFFTALPTQNTFATIAHVEGSAAIYAQKTNGIHVIKPTDTVASLTAMVIGRLHAPGSIRLFSGISIPAKIYATCEDPKIDEPLTDTLLQEMKAPVWCHGLVTLSVVYDYDDTKMQAPSGGGK